MEFVYCYLSLWVDIQGLQQNNAKNQTTANSDKKDRPKIRTPTKKQDKHNKTRQLIIPNKNQYLPWLITSLRCNATRNCMGFSQVESSAPEALLSEVSPTPESQKAHGCVSLKRYGCFPMGFPGKMMTLQKLWESQIRHLNSQQSSPFSPKWWRVTYDRSKCLLPMARIQVRRKSRDQLRFQTTCQIISNCSWQVLQDEVKQLMEERRVLCYFCWFALLAVFACKKTKDFLSLYI